MADLTTRPYAPADAAAFTELMNTIDEHAGGRAMFTAEDTAAMVSALVADPGTDSRMLVTPDGDLVAAGLVSTPPLGGFRADIMGGVHPDWQGRGLGRELLAWQYERAREIHERRAPDATWQVETGALVGDAAGPRLFERLGFTRVRYFFDMVAPTAAASASAGLPDDLHTVEPSAQLAPALYAAHMEAFTDHWGFQQREYEPWISLTLDNPTFRADLSRIAFDGDQIAGYLLGYSDADPQRLYIGQVGTRRPWRGKGLASALLAEILAAAAKAGLSSASLGVDAENPTGALGVYERAGFVQEHSFAAYRRAIG